MASSSSSSRNWSYDVFPSFSGEDVRKTFLSHFLRELERKSIITFKDNEMERSQSIAPELVEAIKDSRIAVIVFSKNYASSSWCLNELLEIMRCNKDLGQQVIPIFYYLDPSHLRKQSGEFGEAFKKTCQNQTEEVKNQWKQALTDVSNILGYHSKNCNSEATMIEEISSHILGKLNLTPSNDFEDFVGIKDHIEKVRLLLHLESDEVRMVGIWGTSGIGKTTIARALFSNLSSQFQSSVYIDRAFISKSMEGYGRANPDDYNMKLRLQENFLFEILGKKNMKIGAMEERLKHQKVLIIIDDLDDQDVLDALVGRTQWFGSGSRIIVVTKNKHFLRAHGIDHVYEACLPSEELALEMFCRYAFRKNSPPDGFMELSSEVALRAGNLPLGLKVLGSYLRGRDIEDWMDMMPRLQNDLDGKIEKTLRVSYDGLNNKKDEAIFRHIACLFNGEKVNDIKLLLAESDLDVNIGLKNLVDKSLIFVREDTIEMHRLLQDMGKEIVRAQSNEPGEREFLVDSKHIYDVLEDNTGTKKVLGIALDINETDGLYIHESAFKGMRNLLFLNFYTKQKKDVTWHLSEGFDHLPPKLRLLSWEKYPLRCMPSNFRPENLVKLQMCESKLEKLWDGVHSLTGLRNMDLRGSENLKEIPDLSLATNLKKLDVSNCTSLVELSSTIQNLNQLEELQMERCENLENLPIGINLESLYCLNLNGCSKLRSFPDISTTISELYLSETAIEEFPTELHLENLYYLGLYDMKSEKLWKRVQPLTPLMTMLSPSLTKLFLSDIPSLVELPSSFQNLHNLEHLNIARCTNLETLPTGVNLELLEQLDFSGCSRLRSFPDISTNIFSLVLDGTGIEEVPWWIEDFYRLSFLSMIGCNNLQGVSLNISKLEKLETVDFSDCEALSHASWDTIPSAVAMATENIHSKLPVCIKFSNCFNLDHKALLLQQSIFKQLILSGGEMFSYFTHRTTGTSLTNIPLLHISPCQPFFRFRACALVDTESMDIGSVFFQVQVSCRFTDRLGNYLDSPYQHEVFAVLEKGSHMVISDCCFPFNEDNAPLAELIYDHVDIQFHFTQDNDELKLIGCGLRLSEADNDLGNEIDGSEEWEDCNDSDLGSESDNLEAEEDT
ncbi:Toll/interleukin-1 receptor homology (TIR) domain [Arabidopsis thaliana x Arabidopsis arenosa]|uniref:ADP-ribosyl cyclase/cyclic ADP-ribose hydrolase n=2 Tax=Arabidopsis TaxID=3701 RepID=A0A178ULT8_ARATH|nr:Toll/interleukin-1 receptor homology (TIR) domain [Arabidopsis thaliana x Arabidopsis arenosa]OAO94625.1 hypothetical protein AXX17_AT5G44920 [Arabidopsis thaliana]